MNQRLITIFGLASVIISIASPVARADWSMFSNYFGNVARAACANDAEAVRKLVIGGDTSPNQTDDKSRSALDCAATSGNLEIIAILVKANVNLNDRDPLGDTALSLAADRNQTAAAKLLLDVGAEVDPQNKDGMTPLMIAANRGNAELVRALLAKGANVSKTDYTGRDAAGWAQDGRNPSVIETLRRAQSGSGS